MRGNLLILCVCCLLISASSRSSAQASFDCAKAGAADEMVFCSATRLNGDKTPSMESGHAGGSSTSDALRWGVIGVLATSGVVGSILLFRRLARPHPEEGPNAKRGSDIRRRARRRRTRFRMGKLFDIKFSPLTDCYIVDRSETGARVRAAKSIGPVQVIRFRDDTDKVACLSKVAWRKGDEFGLVFLDRKSVLSPGEAVPLFRSNAAPL